MPLYDYKCKKCGHVFEIKQSMKEEPLKFCPECKGPIVRLISAAGIIFKGSGFHVTDYGRCKTQDTRYKTKGAGRKTQDSGPNSGKTKETKSLPKAASPKKSK